MSVALLIYTAVTWYLFHICKWRFPTYLFEPASLFWTTHTDHKFSMHNLKSKEMCDIMIMGAHLLVCVNI